MWWYCPLHLLTFLFLGKIIPLLSDPFMRAPSSDWKLVLWQVGVRCAKLLHRVHQNQSAFSPRQSEKKESMQSTRTGHFNEKATDVNMTLLIFTW